MPVEEGSPNPQSTKRVRVLIVVARHQPELWQALKRRFTENEDVQVLLDRRRGERGVWDRTNEMNQRGSDRRRPPSIETDILYRQYVIARAQH
jgi:hypothetical protein